MVLLDLAIELNESMAMDDQCHELEQPLRAARKVAARQMGRIERSMYRDMMRFARGRQP
jgi:phage gp16-like protein